MRKIILGLTAAAAIAAPLALAGSASAATIDAAGKGFVGKGEVQTAFGWHNAAAQKNQTGVKLTAKQATTQALTQSVSQDGYRIGTQQGTKHATQTGTQPGTHGRLAGSHLHVHQRQRHQDLPPGRCP